MTNLATYCEHLNDVRYEGQRQGFYESFFCRANHPTRSLAFWIRYTLFSPKNAPERAIGELWAVWFNAETGERVAVKKEYPLSRGQFSRDGLGVIFPDATLSPGKLNGVCESSGHEIQWELSYDGASTPLLFLPFWMYRAAFPPAKGVVNVPLARYRGHVTINGVRIELSDWVGSQNHNWGTKQTDYYGWVQVAGFDSHPHSFLEMISAQVKIGGVRLPMMTTAVLRHRGEDYAFNGLRQMIGSHAALVDAGQDYRLSFSTQTCAWQLSGEIVAPKSHFVGLSYYNPPGGVKFCLNSKIATCTLHLTDRRRGESERLTTAHRAAFEVITDNPDHGVKMFV